MMIRLWMNGPIWWVIIIQDPYIRQKLATEWEVKEIGPLISKLPFELHSKKFDYKWVYNYLI